MASNRIGPVSYTHLDVYKRQVFLLPCGTKPPVFPSIQVEWGHPLGSLNRKMCIRDRDRVIIMNIMETIIKDIKIWVI